MIFIGKNIFLKENSGKFRNFQSTITSLVLTFTTSRPVHFASQAPGFHFHFSCCQNLYLGFPRCDRLRSVSQGAAASCTKILGILRGFFMIFSIFRAPILITRALFFRKILAYQPTQTSIFFDML